MPPTPLPGVSISVVRLQKASTFDSSVLRRDHYCQRICKRRRRPAASSLWVQLLGFVPRKPHRASWNTPDSHSDSRAATSSSRAKVCNLLAVKDGKVDVMPGMVSRSSPLPEVYAVSGIGVAIKCSCQSGLELSVGAPPAGRAVVRCSRATL